MNTSCNGSTLKLHTTAVIGAGIVGLSTAISLQRAGHSVTLFDLRDPRDKEAYRRAASFGNACTFATGACLPVAMPGILRAIPAMLARARVRAAADRASLPARQPENRGRPHRDGVGPADKGGGSGA